MRTLAAFLDVLDEVNRVRSASVLGERRIVVIDFSSLGITNGVFQNRAEFDRVIDFGLAVGGKMDALRIATAFDVDNTLIGPVVLVVANELTRGFGRKRRFAGARKTKEETGIAVVAFVGRAVHGKEALLRHEIIHDREDALLHFARILGAEDDEFAALKVEVDGSRRSEGFSCRVGNKLPGVEDDVVRFAKAGELFLRGTDQHVVHEERMIGASADDTNLETIFRIPTGESVDDIEMIASIEVVNRARSVLKERGVGDLLVDGPPPNVVGAFGVVDDALVFRTTTGLLTGRVHESANRSNRGFLEGDGVFIELRRGVR